MSSSIEKTFVTNPLSLLQNDLKKLENWQQDKVKITLLDVYKIMIISKIIID